MNIREFVDTYYLHYNAGELKRACKSLTSFMDEGNKLFVAIGGAFSTSQGAKYLAEAIRQNKVHAISCTGANIEEDLFNLVGRKDYIAVPNHAYSTPEENLQFRLKGFNRVTDTCFDDTMIVGKIEDKIFKLWRRDTLLSEYPDSKNYKKYWHEYFYELLLSGVLVDKYQIDPKDCWVLAAAEKNIPLYVPGAEDSTLGNAFAKYVIDGRVSNNVIKNGIDYMIHLVKWYKDNARIEENATLPKYVKDDYELMKKLSEQVNGVSNVGKCDIGFLALGGGIASDFPICVLPMLHYDMDDWNMKHWSWYCQITESQESYGGFSGCTPVEKISWSKLQIDTPKFTINSDYTIVAPLLFGYLLNL